MRSICHSKNSTGSYQKMRSCLLLNNLFLNLWLFMRLCHFSTVLTSSRFFAQGKTNSFTTSERANIRFFGSLMYLRDSNRFDRGKLPRENMCIKVMNLGMRRPAPNWRIIIN
jgi:hypothetical protein